MKYYIVMLIAILTSLCASAYEPLIREDRVWEYSDFQYTNSSFTPEYQGSLSKYKFDGRVEKYGKTYHQFKMFSQSSWDHVLDKDESGNYYTKDINIEVDKPCDRVAALLREENGKVYALLLDSNIIIGYKYGVYDPESHTINEVDIKDIDPATEVVLYDFSTPTGGKYSGVGNDGTNKGFEETYLTPWTVIDDTTIENDSDTGLLKWKQRTVYNDYLQYVMFNDYKDWENIWEPNQYQKTYVEGIGNTVLGDMTLMYCEPYMVTTGGGGYSLPRINLNNVYDMEGKIIFKGKNMKAPTAGVSAVEAEERGDGRMFDLMGREIRNPLPGTVYIRNGRKYVAR